MKQRTTACNCRSSHGCWLRYETWQWRGPRRKYWSRTAALTADYSQQVIRWKVLMNFSACSALADWQHDSSQDQINNHLLHPLNLEAQNDRMCGAMQKISEMVWTPLMSWFVRIKRVVSHIRAENSQRSRVSSENEQRFKREKRATSGTVSRFWPGRLKDKNIQLTWIQNEPWKLDFQRQWQRLKDCRAEVLTYRSLSWHQTRRGRASFPGSLVSPTLQGKPGIHGVVSLFYYNAR